ncbi:MAG: carboxypeptidase regulatory-like domain-containing protein [Acidobacteriota bacterium]
MPARRILHLFLAFFSLFGTAPGQTTATIVGTVTDPSDAVVPGASLTVTHQQTGFTRAVRSNASGVYVAPALPVGSYSITAEAPGFKRKTITGIVLQVNQEARINLVLEVGAVTETLTVTGEASLLQSESAAVGQVIDNRYNTEIPLNGRDFSQLILLVPGANSRPGGAEMSAGATTGSNGSGVAIGGREHHNNFMMDGASNNARQYGSIAIRPSIDAIQEFKVQSSLYSAEFGQAAFGQVNLITKSGTNSLHGSAFEFLRNNVFDARNFFLPEVSRLNRNQFGGTLGGPIVRNRAFFFGNYEGLRERRGVESFRSVPNEAWRGGDFSGLTAALRDPSTARPFPANRIPADRFHKAAKAALAMWPMPNFGAPAATTNNLLVTRPTAVRDDQVTAKVDHEFSSRDRMSGRYSLADHWEISTPSSMLPGFEYIDPPRNQVFALAHTHVFGPRLLAEYRFSFNRSLFKRTYPNSGKDGIFTQFGINHRIEGKQFEGAPRFEFQRIAMTAFGDSETLPLNDVSNEFTHAGSLTRTAGNHSLKAGLSLTRYQQNTPGAVPGSRRGNFVFRGDYTGNAFADLLLGIPWQATRVVGKGVETGRSTWHGYYFNDDWKAGRSLTLNFGLRYEYVSPLVDILDRRSLLYPLTNDFNTGLPGQIIVAKSPEAASLLQFSGVGARALYGADRNNWGPRFGFAYSLRRGTVLRGGYGIFYTNSQNFVNNFVISRRQPPYAETQQRSSSTTRPEIDLADPFTGAGPPSVTSTQNISPDFCEGYVQQWNLTVQRELPGGMSLDAGYVGNKGTKLNELPFFNIPLPQQPGDTRPLQDRRPLPKWGNALGMASYVTSNYHSLQVKAQRRFSKGLAFLTSYTWSKSIDLSSERGSGDRVMDGGDPRNLRGYYRALSGFDVRHRLVISYVYELPFGRGRALLADLNPLADKILGGWELSGITAFQSGFPFSVVMSGDQNGDGLGADRPDLIGRPVIRAGNPNCYIEDPRNAACGSNVASVFAAVPASQGRFGSAGRNILIGPGLKNWDVSLAKNLRFGERARLQFRAEFFNLFNNVNFRQPQRTFNLTSPMFGTINTAARAREMQFGLRLEF